MSFRIATYNILADAYARPDRYPESPPEALDWPRRSRLLHAELHDLDCDVLCLQEVQPEAFEDFDARMRAFGFRGHYARKGQHKPDGCATFVNATVFPDQTADILYFRDGAGSADSGHLALTVVAAGEGKRIGLTNTHIKWDPPNTPAENRWGLRQIEEWLERRETIAPKAEWVVCGDFNVVSEDPVISRLIESGFADAHPRDLGPTCVANGRARKIDFILHTRGIESIGQSPFPLDSSVVLPSLALPSDHVPLVAALTSGAM